MTQIKRVFRTIVLFSVLLIPIFSPNLSNAYINGKSLVDKYRVGCKCCDGWDSEATDRGACSHHDGVQYWIYYDDLTGEYSKEYTGRCN